MRVRPTVLMRVRPRLRSRATRTEAVAGEDAEDACDEDDALPFRIRWPAWTPGHLTDARHTPPL
eukprot:1270041-Pleurochrysis_carterae.AAC.1